MREDYSYFGDGRIATLTDLDDTSGTNPPATLRFLSRGYNYDQVGRVTAGFGTGGAGQGVPYNQTYSYDEFGNMKGRSGIYYSYNNNPFGSDTATYTNNRRNGWTYNANGQVTSSPASSTDDARSVTYDAAGRMITTFERHATNDVIRQRLYWLGCIGCYIWLWSLRPGRRAKVTVSARNKCSLVRFCFV